jgi:hypothetical protein
MRVTFHRTPAISIVSERRTPRSIASSIFAAAAEVTGGLPRIQGRRFERAAKAMATMSIG